MNRRQLLKLGAGSIVTALLSPLVFGQTKAAATATASSVDVAAGSIASKMDGLISYNAGWVIQLEDKERLLEVEARKTKEKEELDKQKSGNLSVKTGDSVDKSKSLSGKFQELLGKIKGFF